MKLIWTYDGRVKVSRMSETNRRTILINYYIISITKAKKLGYYTILYTDSSSVNLFKDLADETIIVDSYEDSMLWDYLKIKVLEDRNDEFCLIDGDVIVKQKFPEFTTDITFDTYEVGNWYREYAKPIKELNELGINNIIDIWDINKKPVINCGILQIKNKEHRILYVEYWKKYNNWIKENHINYNIDIDYATMIGAQYLLTLIVNHNNLTKTNLNSSMGEEGKYHRHYFGMTKFFEGIVPDTHIIEYNNRKTII